MLEQAATAIPDAAAAEVAAAMLALEALTVPAIPSPQSGEAVAPGRHLRLRAMASTVDPVPRAKRTAKAHEHFVHLPTRLWKLLLAGGLVTWLIAAVVTEITDDNVLVPTVIIVGRFMVPVTMAAFALSRRRDGYLTTEEVVLGFLLAGTLGSSATALLET